MNFESELSSTIICQTRIEIDHCLLDLFGIGIGKSIITLSGEFFQFIRLLLLRRFRLKNKQTMNSVRTRLMTRYSIWSIFRINFIVSYGEDINNCH